MGLISRRDRVARLLAMTLFIAPAARIVTTVYAQTISQQSGSSVVLLPTGVVISLPAVPGASQQLLISTIANWPYVK